MKKPNKKVVASLCATSLATIGFISYKTIKKNPNLLKDLKDLKDKCPVLNNLLKDDKEDVDEKAEEKNLDLVYTHKNFSPNNIDKTVFNERKVVEKEIEQCINQSQEEQIEYEFYEQEEEEKIIEEEPIEEEAIEEELIEEEPTEEELIEEELIEEEPTEEELIEEEPTEEELIEEELIEEEPTEEELIEEEPIEKESIEEDYLSDNVLKDSDIEFNQDFIEGLKAEIDELMNFEKEFAELEDNQKTIIYEPVYKNKVVKPKEEEVILPDEYIEDEIRYQLCLTNKEKITNLTLKKLDRMDFFEIGDSDMEIYCDFLSKYTNIKSIVVDSLNPIKNNGDILNYKNHYSLKNVQPITKLKSLEELSFNWGIENIDFSTLKDLPNLRKLELKFGMIDNIEFLKNFKELEHLEIMLSSNISDISTLLELKNLKKLYLYTNAQIDLDILKKMDSLKYLYINGESISI